MSEELRENKMGTMPVRRLVLSMSLPMMIAMLVQALYNVVDSYFVAKLSENALTAVGMVLSLIHIYWLPGSELFQRRAHLPHH